MPELRCQRISFILVRGRSFAPAVTRSCRPPWSQHHPRHLSASTVPSASPRVGSEAPAPAGLAITPFGAASLAGKARTTEATGSDQPNTLPFLNLETFALSPPPCVEQFVPNRVESVGVKRAGEDLEEAAGCGEGARGAVARKKSKANADDSDAPPIKEEFGSHTLLECV